MSALHILFSPSAAIDLRRALGAAGRDDQVIAHNDDLSFGPINPSNIAERAKWVDEVLGYSGHEELAPEQEEFWSEALADRPQRIVWVSRRSTVEFCGFLEWLRRNGERPFEVVDLTDVELPHDGRSGTPIQAPVTPLIHADQFLAARLWDLAIPLAAEARVKWLALWDKLRAENAPLRVLTPDGLESAPLNVFDGQILAHVGEDWGKAALTVGHVLYESAHESFCPAGIHQTGDMVLVARIAALAAAGAIEARGDPHELKTCTIRCAP